MNNTDHDKDTFTGRVRRNGRRAIGAAGVAAVLGAGAFLLAGQDDDAENADAPTALTVTTEPTASIPASASAAASMSASASVSGEATADAVPGPVTSATSKSVGERAAEARSANKRLGTEVRRPAPQSTIAVDPGKVKVKASGTTKKNLRVSWSQQDLTGYRELAWVRGGEKHGRATCSQSITVSEDVPPKHRPTLMICWRTSAKKSAYTVAVDFKGHPSAEDSVAALDKAWASMS